MGELTVPQQWVEAELAQRAGGSVTETGDTLVRPPQPGKLERVLNFVGFIFKSPFAIGAADVPAVAMSEHFGMAEKRNNLNPDINIKRVR